MKSPKFQFSTEDIILCISLSNLKKAWTGKLGAQLRKQLIMDLVEYRDFEIDTLCKEIVKDVQNGNYRPWVPHHYLVEKSRGLCRQMTLVHPRDLLVLQALSSELQKDIEASAPTKKAFYKPGDQKFNQKKLLIAAGDYGAIASWKNFQNSIFEFSKERNFVVVTDVANFYDFINFKHLRNIIASHCDVKESLLDLLLFVLNEIAWNPDFMPRSETGLPQIDVEAPRVLANAMLFELDKIASNHSLDDYVRFMDDIDVGVDTIEQAKVVVRDIDLTLQTRQLRLNSSKTKILSSKKGEVAKHFCIKENALLDECASILEESSAPNSEEQTITKLRRYYRVWRNSNYDSPISSKAAFFKGNGSKIFKRTTKLLRYVGVDVPADDLLWIIKNNPALRSFSFGLLGHQKSGNRHLYELINMLEQGVFIDHSSLIDLAKYMVHGHFINNQKFQKYILKVIDFLSSRDEYFSVYSALVISFRFCSPKEILNLVKVKKEHWKNDFWLGRTVGAVRPEIVKSPHVAAEYLQLLHNTRNSSALDVWNFHQSIEQDIGRARSLFNYANSKNPSYPSEIYFPKTLIIHSIFLNSNSNSYKKKILQTHPILKSDSQYKKWAFL